MFIGQRAYSQENSQTHIPENLEEAIVALDKIISDEDKEEIKNMSEDDFLGETHLGIGMYIRNQWGLWEDSKLKKSLERSVLDHPDDMSWFILKEYYRHLVKNINR